MVYQGSDVLREHLRCTDIHTMWHLLVHVLDTMRVLQPPPAILGFGALCSTVTTGPRAACLFLAPVPDPAEEWQYSGVCATAHSLLSVAHIEGGLDRNLWLVHLGRGMAAELDLLQAMPWSVQAVVSGHLHSGRKAAYDTHRLLPLVPSTLPRSTASSKATRRIADRD